LDAVLQALPAVDRSIIMRLLIVEDEKKLCDAIAKSLHGAGYEGDEALRMILEEKYDLLVLDLNLPGTDGMEILRTLRQENEETKVLILSARSQIADKVEGLDAGANDYMEKPFHLQELEARVRSLTRRRFVQKDVCLECDGVKFNTRERVAYVNGAKVILTRKENGILEYLLLNQGRPVSQEELIVWDATADSFSNSIRVHMSSLRKKLKAELGYDPIVNKIGEGYRIGDKS
jgi:two-component system OmpR family response regulator